MNAALALHIAARRYCLNRHAYWCKRYSEIARNGGDRQGNGYTTAALATFPRYNVLNAIRIELERIDPGELADLEKTKAFLILVGETAEDDFTRLPINEIDEKAMAEERHAFCHYISGLQTTELKAVEALPFRRVLKKEESKAIWSRMRFRWEIPDGYWFPLVECKLSDVMAFKVESFNEAVTTERLGDLLSARGIQRVWELREYGPEYEEDIALFKPFYNGAEGYWLSIDMDWIIYASHESSVTVGGWLLEELKAIWPSWKSQMWTGIFH